MRRTAFVLIVAALALTALAAAPAAAAEESIHQADTDFTNATLNNILISGSGDDAQVVLNDATGTGTWRGSLSGAELEVLDHAELFPPSSMGCRTHPGTHFKKG